MDKWAHYCIAEVRYGDTHSEISAVRACEDLRDGLGKLTTWTKGRVVSTIQCQRKTFVTITRRENGKYGKGAAVHVVEAKGGKYLRTDGNNIASDNLGSLPEF